MLYAVTENLRFVFKIKVKNSPCDAAVVGYFLESGVFKALADKNSKGAVQYFFTPFIMFNYDCQNYSLLFIIYHIDKKNKELRRC